MGIFFFHLPFFSLVLSYLENGRGRFEESFPELRQPRKEWRHGARTRLQKLDKDCGLYNKTCTSTDGDITFQKFGGNKGMHFTFDVFLKFIDELAPQFYKGDANAVQKYRQLIVDKGSPDNKGTKVATGNNVGKMTDTAQYTGAHKERFDESGKGKGKEGREDVTANDGYVTGYKGKDTYDKK